MSIRHCEKCGRELKTPYTHLIKNGIHELSENWNHLFLCNLCWNYILDWIYDDRLLPTYKKTTEEVEEYQKIYGKESI